MIDSIGKSNRLFWAKEMDFFGPSDRFFGQMIDFPGQSDQLFWAK
jgi:hypothetical protein